MNIIEKWARDLLRGARVESLGTNRDGPPNLYAVIQGAYLSITPEVANAIKGEREMSIAVDAFRALPLDSGKMVGDFANSDDMRGMLHKLYASFNKAYGAK